MPQSQVGAPGGILPNGAPLITQNQSTPSNPTGTTSTTAVMAGLAGTVTPTETGRVLITISGDCANSVATDGGKLQIATGTGTAPANGAAAAGTTQGALVQATSATAAAKVPFSITAIVTGLTVGTAAWIDLQFLAVTGGTFSLADVTIAAVEF